MAEGMAPAKSDADADYEALASVSRSQESYQEFCDSIGMSVDKEKEEYKESVSWMPLAKPGAQKSKIEDEDKSEDEGNEECNKDDKVEVDGDGIEIERVPEADSHVVFDAKDEEMPAIRNVEDWGEAVDEVESSGYGYVPSFAVNANVSMDIEENDDNDEAKAAKGKIGEGLEDEEDISVSDGKEIGVEIDATADLGQASYCCPGVIDEFNGSPLPLPQKMPQSQPSEGNGVGGEHQDEEEKEEEKEENEDAVETFVAKPDSFYDSLPHTPKYTSEEMRQIFGQDQS